MVLVTAEPGLGEKSVRDETDEDLEVRMGGSVVDSNGGLRRQRLARIPKGMMALL